MAEIFGIVTGALSVAALFNNCVDTFEYIQLGRHFGEDFQRCQLKLDVAKTRLGRWGEAARVNNEARFATTSPTDRAVQNAQEILEDIAGCFEAARNKSRRYEARNNGHELEVFQDSDMNPTFRRLHNRSRDITRQRQKATGMAKKVAWALYDGKSFERIIDQISSWVDELEKLFPIEAAQRKLAIVEIEDVDDELSLETLKNTARGIDPIMEDVVDIKLNTISGKNSAGHVNVEGSARFQVGNVFLGKSFGHGLLINDRTSNSTETVWARDECRVQIGNVYGGKGVWDN
ncbi:hypothetical protein F52700_9430 [Fusarium sp. NRRL 52700]|nr:hypothetical protein F52700_9430 [Fusarium sp. NRRL 52700]